MFKSVVTSEFLEKEVVAVEKRVLVQKCWNRTSEKNLFEDAFWKKSMEFCDYNTE